LFNEFLIDKEETGVTALIALLTYITQAIDVLLWIFLLVATLDYLTGMMRARVSKEYCWDIDTAVAGILKKFGIDTAVAGILKKFGIIIIVVMAVLLDYIFIAIIGISDYTIIYIAITSWYIAAEMMSVLDNLDEMGVIISPTFMAVLEKFKQIAKNMGNSIIDE